MKTKDFFKSQTFKCILVLVCIALVSGGTLAILSDVLYVSDTERTQRAIKALYGKQMDFEVVEYDEENATNQYGNILSAFLLSDGNYLVKAEGTQGYKNGSVTLWGVMKFSNDQFVGIQKVVYESNNKQTLMSSFSTSFFDVYSNNNDKVTQGGLFTIEDNGKDKVNIIGGATFTSNAVNNGVNAILLFTKCALVK